MLALASCLLFLLSGCRVRTTTGGGQENTAVTAGSGLTDRTLQGEDPPEEAGYEAARESGSDSSGDSGERGGLTRENPDALRKEYDENAPAEIVQGRENRLSAPGEGAGTGRENDESGNSANRLNDRVEETALQTVPAGEAEKTGVSEDAEAADSALTYFTVLLQDRAGSMYECQRANIYWETARDHVTIHKTAPEHTILLTAGGYDVSARLLPENLQVDDGWVVRKNPQAIVKAVDGGILGGSVHSTNAAKAVYQAVLRREGWQAIDAVRNGQVLLLSEELLDEPWLRTAAAVMVARTASPDLFADVDGNEALNMLAEEATGTIPAGIYFYTGREE